MSRLSTSDRTGFTLVEVVLVIIIIGILATVAMRTIGKVNTSAKVEQTRQEMDALAVAIAGNPQLVNNGIRTDFGYVGDVGAMPPNLDALVQNPGGYTTWRGPYISRRFTQMTDDYKKDAWNTEYTYTQGVTITSTGDVSGDNIVRRIAPSTDHLLRNRVTGNVYDLNGTPPGAINTDSVLVRLIYPNGAGSWTTRAEYPDAGGFFDFDSVPIGNHDLEIIYRPDNDTLRRFVSVLANSRLYTEYHLADDVWHEAESWGSLIGYYPLNESSGLIAGDLTGLAPDADLKNDPSGSGWGAGKIGGAFEFDGYNDYFETPTGSTQLQITGDYSISVWIYAEPDQDEWAGIVCRCTPTGDDNHWTLQWDNSGGTSKRMTLYHSGGSWKSDYRLSEAMSNWHHIAVTYRLSPARVQLFVDGALHSETTSLTAGPGSGNGKLRIGCDRTNHTWHGKIDDVRIYEVILTPGEIQALYNAGS